MHTLIKKWDAPLQRAAPFLIGAGAILSLVILIYWRTLTIFYAPYSLIATPKPTPAWAATLFSLRWVVVVFSTFLFCLFFYIEVRLRTLTNIFRFLLTHRLWSVITLIALTLIGRSYFFLPGRLALGDNSNVTFNIWAMRYWIETATAGLLVELRLMGSPFSQFHLSLYYYFGGLIDLLIRDPYLSNKIVGMIAHIAMTYSMFIYVRHLTRSIWLDCSPPPFGARRFSIITISSASAPLSLRWSSHFSPATLLARNKFGARRIHAGSRHARPDHRRANLGASTVWNVGSRFPSSLRRSSRGGHT